MNIERLLDQVAADLEWLVPEPVFVGGATIGLFLDDLGRSQLRPTLDVDCIAPQLVSRAAWYQLEAVKRRELLATFAVEAEWPAPSRKDAPQLTRDGLSRVRVRAVGDREHELLEVSRRAPRGDAIPGEEANDRRGAHPLVAIHEGVALVHAKGWRWFT